MEYSASTSIACVPMLLHRTAVAAAAGDRGLQRGSPQCVAAVQRAAERFGVVSRGRDIGRAAGSWPSCILTQPSSRRCLRATKTVFSALSSSPARTARPITLRARTGSPPCRAASVTSAAGVSGATPVVLLFGGDRLAKARNGSRIGQLERLQESFGEAAGGARGRRRRPGALGAQRRTCGGQITRGERHDRSRRADERVGIRPEPPEQFGRLGRAAVVHGDAGGDPHRGGAFGGVLGAEQFVGQTSRGGAVAGQRERIGQLRSQRRRAGVGGRAVQPCGPRGLAVAVGRQLRQCSRPAGRRAGRARPGCKREIS